MCNIKYCTTATAVSKRDKQLQMKAYFENIFSTFQWQTFQMGTRDLFNRRVRRKLIFKTTRNTARNSLVPRTNGQHRLRCVLSEGAPENIRT
jgi:hypothetical protein